LTALLQILFNCGEFQNTSLTPDKRLMMKILVKIPRIFVVGVFKMVSAYCIQFG